MNVNLIPMNQFGLMSFIVSQEKTSRPVSDERFSLFAAGTS